jgi:hypothetical protein
MAASEVFVTGLAAQPGASRRLRAGPVAIRYDEADVRYLSLADEEIVRRIHVAVRDDQWGTIPGVVSEMVLHDELTSFDVRWRSEHRERDIHFVWQGHLSGDRSGTVTFEMDGEALSGFSTNRVGCCVLLPASAAGRRCRVTHADGSPVECCLPAAIDPIQPVNGFHDVKAIQFETSSTCWIEIRCEGDEFEVEDQRNWLDASFKLYSRPLRAPAPYRLERGIRIRQQVCVRLVRDSGLPIGAGKSIPARLVGRKINRHGAQPGEVERVRIAVDDSHLLGLPRLGVAAPLGTVGATAIASRIRPLGLSHLRVDLEPTDETGRARVDSMFDACATLGLPVEVALHLPETPAEDETWIDVVSRAETRRILVHQQGSVCTTQGAIERVRRAVRGRRIEIGGGTRGDLFELNVDRPTLTDADFVFWSMTPQWHATDLLSLAETPQTVGDQVRSMRGLYPELPHVVSPITLLPRVSTAGGAWVTDDRPAQATATDARQPSLACAAWTLAMISQLAQCGVMAATFYECLGPRGLMPSPGNGIDNSAPTVFPVWLVLAALAGFPEASGSRSSHPEMVAVLALRRDRARRLLIANLTDEPQDVEIAAPFRRPVSRSLDETNVQRLMRQPELFQADIGETAGVAGDRNLLRLERFAIVQIDDCG